MSARPRVSVMSPCRRPATVCRWLWRCSSGLVGWR